jgi:hypothetical protein
MMIRPIGTIIVFFLATSPLLPAAAVDYTREVQPVLSEYCFHCHGTDEKDRKGGLRLDVRDAALKGGESDGPAIVPGKPEQSSLITRILSHDSDEVMPPPKVKNPVPAAKLEMLKQWITEGANYAKHWAFEAPKKPAAPAGSHALDHFVSQKLATMGLPPSAPADAATLCRRLHLDIIGLPPSPKEVASFQTAHQTDAAAAVRDLVTRLMKTPAYGEKWARHWLDVARYSDSNGYEKDLPREQWAWRDWVIKAFNNDMPYDRFLIEQIAGDLLPAATQEQIVATGFLRNSMINEEGAIVPEQFRMDEMFDRMDCVGKAVLGLSLQCAQCHSHKFDPVSQDEYYGMFAFLNNVYEAQSWVFTPEQQKQIAAIRTRVAALEDRLKRLQPQWQEEMAAWEKGVLSREVAWTRLSPVETGSTSGLNHPTVEPDQSVLTLGHPTTNGDIFIISEPEIKDITGLRMEALKHGDQPFHGPGRSKYGTWAITELSVHHQPPGSEKWEPLKLVNATADYSEEPDRMEPEWNSESDPKQKRTRGPVAFMIDGSHDTAWRADRGPGLRNQESVAVVQFEKPLTLPQGTKLKVTLLQNHSGGRSDRFNTQLGRCRLSLTQAANPKAQPVDHAAILAMQTPPGKRTAEQHSTIFTAWRASLSSKDALDVNNKIAAEWKKFPQAPTSVLHLAERQGENARLTKLLDRGIWDQPKHQVSPHVPAALHPMEKPGAENPVTEALVQTSTKSDVAFQASHLPPPTRLHFAHWLASKQSPLTARVAVNRVWQAIFGAGLVETSEDFGTRAPVPEYLDILDWLAVDFMEHGWSHQHLITTILTSATYQQSSKASPALLERDPRNRLLTRGPRFRMEAEVVRDTALSVAGLLHQQVGGPSIFPPVPQSMLDYNYFKPTYWTPPEGPERYRRALYMFRKRSMPDPVMSSFDAPNGDAACARRPRSNTPLSALTSLNETVFVEAAQALAQRIIREGGADDISRADYAYHLCTARPIRPAESDRIIKLLAKNRVRLRKGELKAGDIAFSKFTKPESLPADATPNDLAAWTLISRVLLNLDETMTKN